MCHCCPSSQASVFSFLDYCQGLPSVLPASDPASTSTSKISFKDTHLLMSFPCLKPFSGATLRIKCKLICMVCWALQVLAPIYLSSLLPLTVTPRTSRAALSLFPTFILLALLYLCTDDSCIQLVLPHLCCMWNTQLKCDFLLGCLPGFPRQGLLLYRLHSWDSIHHSDYKCGALESDSLLSIPAWPLPRCMTVGKMNYLHSCASVSSSVIWG